ncbi:Protein of unknown function [Gryllus bimaculatus]|nr:Protein of unknown function [Gryllus bimaculatus]
MRGRQCAFRRGKEELLRGNGRASHGQPGTLAGRVRAILRRRAVPRRAANALPRRLGHPRIVPKTKDGRKAYLGPVGEREGAVEVDATGGSAPESGSYGLERERENTLAKKDRTPSTLSLDSVSA